jgi:hypothetical protein
VEASKASRARSMSSMALEAKDRAT